jgi:hypothetical protein
MAGAISAVYHWIRERGELSRKFLPREGLCQAAGFKETAERTPRLSRLRFAPETTERSFQVTRYLLVHLTLTRASAWGIDTCLDLRITALARRATTFISH